jgi:hypothetical protein
MHNAMVAGLQNVSEMALGIVLFSLEEGPDDDVLVGDPADTRVDRLEEVSQGDGARLIRAKAAAT